MTLDSYIDQSETWHSAGEAVLLGAGLPLVAQTAWNKLSPPQNFDTKLKRSVACHVGIALVCVLLLPGKSLHDNDPRYTNVILVASASLPITLVIHAIRSNKKDKRHENTR